MAELGSLLSALLLDELGFQTVERSNILRLLREMECSGRTALRDAVLTGVQMMLKLGEALRKMGCFENYNFVHVVLTDGADNESKATVRDLEQLFLLIGLTIPVKSLTTHFIGVDMNSSDARELKEITDLGLQNSYFHLANSGGLETIFTKIIASIKEQQQIRVQAMSMGGIQAVRIQQQSNPYLQLTVKRYVVLFTLDRSGSMSGTRWSKVCQCVTNFMETLGDNDLVAAIAFNAKVNVITRSSASGNQNKKKPLALTYNQSQQSSQSNATPANQPRKKKTTGCSQCLIF